MVTKGKDFDGGEYTAHLLDVECSTDTARVTCLRRLEEFTGCPFQTGKLVRVTLTIEDAEEG